MSSPRPPLVRTRLSIMMFLEFFLWGGWGFAITGYAANLGFSGGQIGMLGAVSAIGAIVSPLLVGFIADRYFAAQRILFVLHLLGGVCLILAGFQKTAPGLITLMMLNGLFFMPTIALVNSVGFRHIPDPKKFPRIAVLGTVGWIIAVLLAQVFLGGTANPKFLFQSGVAGIVLAFYCLTLPHTPPKGKEAGGDVFGLGALRLLKEGSLLVFTLCVFVVSLPACGYFFTLQLPMLQSRGYPSPLALASLNQFSELIFMFSMPWFVSRLGLKRVVALGMLAWGMRYLCFACPDFYVALLGLALHGFCYSFFYVGSYMYFNERAPAELKSSAQSLITFLLVGVGMFAGSLGGGQMLETFPAPVRNMAAALGDTSGQDSRPLPPWEDPNAATSAWRYLDLSGTVSSLVYGEQKKEAAPDLAAKLDADRDGTITLAEVQAAPEATLQFGERQYQRDELVTVFKKIASLPTGGAVPDDQVRLTRKQWLAAQSPDWEPIWLYPGIGVMVMLVIFLIAFRPPPKSREPEPATTG